MSRPYEGAPTCEGCPSSIDVRVWHRQGLLRSGQRSLVRGLKPGKTAALACALNPARLS